MKRKANITVYLFGAVIFLTSGCSEQSAKETELRHYSLNSLQGVITQSGVAVDKDVTSDGDGALRITAEQPVTIRLFETGDLDVENTILLYRAKLRTEKLEGKAYLEMWCHFPGKGEFFSRALQAPLSGSVDWTTQETPFFLKKSENPDNVKLNLMIDGKGTVWIDAIRLLKSSS